MASNAVGVLNDVALAFVPLVAVVTAVFKVLLALVMAVLPAVLAFLRFAKRKIKRKRISPPPPIWQMVKMPPLPLDLISKILKGHLLNLLFDLAQTVQPILVTYLKTFAKLSAKWMAAEGADEVDKQFTEVFDSEHERTAIDLSEFVDRFHKGAATATLRLTLMPALKSLAQTTIDRAVVVATEAAKVKKAVGSGEDLMAAAKQAFSPALIKKLTELTGALGPALSTYLKVATKAMVAWLKAEGQKLIDQAQAKLEELAASDDTGGVLSDGPDIGDSPILDLMLSTDFSAIPDLAEFRMTFADDVAQALNIDKSRVGVTDVRAGNEGTVVAVGFTAEADPSPQDLIQMTLQLFETPADELPGLLSELQPTVPVARLNQNAMVQQLTSETIVHAFVECAWKLFDEVALPAIQVYRRAATKAADEWAREDDGDGAVPVGDFQKTGLKQAYMRLRPVMETLQGEVGNRAKSIHLAEEDRSTDMHRKLAQAVGEIVWERTQRSCSSKLDTELELLGVESVIIRNRLRRQAYAIIEQQTRAAVYHSFVEKTAKVAPRLLPKRRERETEEGSEKAVDDAGFLVSEGGFAAFQSGKKTSVMVMGVDPQALATRLLDDDIVAQLEGTLESLTPVLKAAIDRAVEVKTEWERIQAEEPELSGLQGTLMLVTRLSGLSKIKGLIPKPIAAISSSEMGLATEGVGGDTKALKVVPGSKQAAQLASALGIKASDDDVDDAADSKHLPTAPTALFVKLGLAQAIEELRPLLAELGGAAAERSDAIHISIEQRSTDCRRALDLLLQELVVAKAEQEVFPQLITRMEALELEPQVVSVVEQHAHNQAEEDLRLCVHDQLLRSWEELQTAVQVQGTRPEEEAGADADEDEYGFLLAEGGFAGYREPLGSVDMDISEMFESREIDPMTQVELLLRPVMAELAPSATDGGALFVRAKGVLQVVQSTVLYEKKAWSATKQGKAALKAADKLVKQDAKELGLATRMKGGTDAATVGDGKDEPVSSAKEASTKEGAPTIPTNAWVKTGLIAAIEYLQPLLAEERMASIQAQPDDRGETGGGDDGASGTLKQAQASVAELEAAVEAATSKKKR
eukprot:COSAG01_NODE_2270_length_8029_cov_28.731400_1_plen_1090_part_10